MEGVIRLRQRWKVEPRRWTSAGLAAWLLLAGATVPVAVGAQEAPAGAAALQESLQEALPATGIPVELAGVVILRIRTGSAGYGPFERANFAYKRLLRALDTYRNELSASLVAVRMVGTDPVLCVGDIPIITVDPEHAVIHRTPRAVLAEIWAANLRRAIEAYVQANPPESGPPPEAANL